MQDWGGFRIVAPGCSVDGFHLSGLWCGRGTVRCIPGPLYSGSDETIKIPQLADISFLQAGSHRVFRTFDTAAPTAPRAKAALIALQDSIDDTIKSIADQLDPLHQCRLYMYLHALGHRMSTAAINYADGLRRLEREAKRAKAEAP